MSEELRAEFEKYQVNTLGQFQETVDTKMSTGEYLLPRLEQDWRCWQAAYQAGRESLSAPVAWRVQDFGDSWILCESLQEVKNAVGDSNNLVQPLYVMSVCGWKCHEPAPPTEGR